MERDYRRILNSKANKTPFSPKPPGRKEGNNGDQLVTEINGDIRLYRKELNRWFYVPLSDSGKSKSTDVATSTTLGLVKIGSGLSITATGELTASGSSANYYLDGITKSSNTLTFSVNGATNQTYTFGSNAFNSTTIPTNTNELTNGAGFLTAVATANIADEAVTLAKLAHVATDIFLGRTSNGSGDVEAMSVSDVTTLLNLDNYLTSVSTLNADKLTAGTIPDARVPASAVTQHVASIVHDSLSGFVANEHIDWTSDQGSTNIHSGNYTDTNTNQLTRFYFVDDDGDSVHPSHDHYIKFMNGTGITTNWNATDAAGTSGDPHILTITSTTNGTVTAVGTSGSISGGTINTTGTITHLTSAGHSHVPTTLNQSGKFLKAGSNSGLSEAWTSITESDITDLGTYLTTSSASSTYLPKTSPTLTADTTLSMNNGKISARTSAGGGSDGIGSAGQVLHSHGAGGGVYWGTIASAPSVNIYDGDGTEVNLTNKWMKFVEGSDLIDINFTDTSDGAFDDPYDLTFTINSGNITSVGTLSGLTVNGNVYISEYLRHSGNVNTHISFSTDEIKLRTDSSSRLIARNANVEIYPDLVLGEDVNLSVDKLVNFGDTSGSSDRMLIRKNSGGDGEINVLSSHDLILRTDDTTRLTIESGGGVTVSGKLDVDASGGSGGAAHDGTYGNVMFDSNNHNYVQIGSPNNKYGALFFSDDVANAGHIYYFHTDNSMRFGTDATNALILDSSQNATFAGVLKVEKAGSGNAIGIFEDPSGNANVLISAPTSNKNSILNFGDSANVEAGQLDFDHADNSFVLRIDGTERFDINSSLTYLNTDLKISDDLYFNSANAWLIASAGGGTLRIQTFAYFRVDGVIRGYDDVIAYYSSDPTLKDNAKLIENPLDKLSKINGYTFDWNKKAQKIGNHLTGHDYGVMANEIQDVMPELVETRENGIRAVKYEKIIPLLIECIKKQQTQINELKGIA